MSGVSEDVRGFIFEHIDSAEQLEVLLLLRSTPDQAWNAKSICGALRTNEASVENRLRSLKTLELVETLPDGFVRFSPKDQATRKLIDDLADAFRVRRHKIYELIFSPLKKARSFADAFVVRGPGKEEGDDDG